MTALFFCPGLYIYQYSTLLNNNLVNMQTEYSANFGKLNFS